MIDIDKLRDIILTGNNSAPAGTTLIPNNFEVVPGEQFRLNPDRMRGKFECKTHGELIEYITFMLAARLAGSGHIPAIFIANDAMIVSCILDYGTENNPGWGEHAAVCTVSETPAYTSILRLCRTPVGQLEMLEWIEDFGHLLTFETTEDGTRRPTSRDEAYAQFREVTAEYVRTSNSKRDDFSRARTAMEKIAMKSLLPSHVTLHGACYEGIGEERREFRINASEHGGSILFGLRAISAELNDDSARKMLLEEIEAAVENAELGIPIFTGEWTSGMPNPQ